MSTDDICPICLDSPCDGRLACGHAFCFSCLDEWYRRQLTQQLYCPYCKARIETALDWWNATLWAARSAVVLSIIYIDWLYSIQWQTVSCLFLTASVIASCAQVLWIMYVPSQSLVSYILRLWIDIIFDIEYPQSFDAAVNKLVMHYDNRCSIWSDVCLGHKTQFYSRVMRFTTMPLLCAVGLWLFHVRLKKSFAWHAMRSETA